MHTISINKNIIIDRIKFSIQNFDKSYSSQSLKLIPFENFTNLWLKDESLNPTGTHKDRLGKVVLQIYQELLEASVGILHHLPHASIISSGSAAMAIQNCLKEHFLPNLKVLVDEKICPKIIEQMLSIGCEIYKTDLASQLLDSKDILQLTSNVSGFELNSQKYAEYLSSVYDSFSRELLAQEPDVIFLPYGSGLLYENILSHLMETSGNKLCHLMGSTTNDPDSKAIKLYAPYKPFVTVSNDHIRHYIKQRHCGKLSGIYELKEECLQQAHTILQKDCKMDVECSAAAGLALFLEFQSVLSKSAKILVVSTGHAKSPAKLSHAFLG